MDNDIVLEDDQNDEVSQIMETIEKEAAGELEEVFRDTTLGPTARYVWNEDKRNSKVEFFKDQQLNCKFLRITYDLLLRCLYNSGNGKRQNRWSVITIRI